jgi:uncharacterized protein
MGRVLALLVLCAALPAQAQPKPGFDCARATAATDRLICADSGLADQDRALAERYEALHRSLSAEGFAVLRKDQVAWLSGRGDCQAKDKSRADSIACLREAYTSRTNELDKQFKSAGGLSIEKRVTARRLPHLRVDEADSYPWLVGRPPATVDAFNRYIATRLQVAKGLFAASGIKLDASPPGDTTFSRYYEVHRFDDRMLSVEFYQYHESYVGHAWRSEFVINWDLRRNRALRMADIFRPDANWQRAIYDYAMKSIRDDGEIKDPENWFPLEAVVDDDAWLFEDDGAVLLFGHGERSMVGASAEVTIPDEVLQPLLRPDAPMAASPG